MYKGTVDSGLTFSYWLASQGCVLRAVEEKKVWELYFPVLAAIFLIMASTSLRSLSLRLTA
jgi:hypothetical protein